MLTSHNLCVIVNIKRKTGPEKGADNVEKTQAPVPVSCGGAGHTCRVLDVRTGERV